MGLWGDWVSEGIAGGNTCLIDWGVCLTGMSGSGKRLGFLLGAFLTRLSTFIARVTFRKGTVFTFTPLKLFRNIGFRETPFQPLSAASV